MHQFTNKLTSSLYGKCFFDTSTTAGPPASLIILYVFFGAKVNICATFLKVTCYLFPLPPAVLCYYWIQKCLLLFSSMDTHPLSLSILSIYKLPCLKNIRKTFWLRSCSQNEFAVVTLTLTTFCVIWPSHMLHVKISSSPPCFPNHLLLRPNDLATTCKSDDLRNKLASLQITLNNVVTDGPVI